MKLLISKLLSYAIMVGALVQRVPQILKIWPSGTVQGLSAFMFLMDSVGYTITVAYNRDRGYAFSTYGENYFLLLQGMVIVLLIFWYSRAMLSVYFLGVAAGYTALCYTLFAPRVLNSQQVEALYLATIPIFCVGRVPQIIKNFVNGHTGALAMFPLVLAVVGAAARIFTTLQETSDSNVLLGYVLGGGLNTILLLQILFYWSATDAKLRVEAEKKKK